MLIYGGSAYSYANDIGFKDVSSSEDFWQRVIDTYYQKYFGMAAWHERIVKESKEKRKLVIPSGRYYPFEPEFTNGKFRWPITRIKNYPVQGFGADLVKLARLEANRRLREEVDEYKLVMTIHDSIVVDAPSRNLDQIAHLLLESVQAVPRLVKQVWDCDFNLPLTAEVQYGPNKKDMTDYKFT